LRVSAFLLPTPLGFDWSNMPRGPQAELDMIAAHASTLWILGPKDRQLPDSFMNIAPSVFRLSDCGNVTPHSKLLALLFNWDRGRVEGPSKNISLEVQTPLKELAAKHASTKQPVVVSACRAAAMTVAAGFQGSIYWLEIDGFGATEPDAIWLAWINDQTTVQVALRKVSATEESIVGTLEVRMSRVSPALCHLDALRASTSLVIKALQAAQSGSSTAIRDSKSSRSMSERPSALRVAARIARRRLEAKLFANGPDQWLIAVARRCNESFDDARSLLPDPLSLGWIEPPTDGFIADPCLQRVGSSSILFYEEARAPNWRGLLKAVALDSAGHPCGPNVTILERPHHLSFPNTFLAHSDAEWLYLLPEQAERGTTALYRSAARAKPSELAFDEYQVLLDNFEGIDPVLHWKPPYWYLFVTDGRYWNTDNNLLIFYSEKLEGPYVPHVGNPVRLGLRGSRMAGKLFLHNGRLIRPGQDCTIRYGARVILYAIDCLSPDCYRETEICAFGPEVLKSDYLGLHTISLDTSLIAIDALRYRKPRA
jgi:hypothetical protein